MKKRDKRREIKFNLYVILFIFIISIVIYFTMNPIYTGYSILESAPLSESSLTYDENLIDFTNGIIKLKSSASTSTWTTYSQQEFNITSAYYNFINKTQKAFAKDDNRFIASPSKITNIVFENFLNNNDIITLYLKNQKTTNIYLCPPDIECTLTNYGSVYFPNQEGYYNITIQNLNYPAKVFNLISDEALDVDYITSNQGILKEVWYGSSDKTNTLSILDNTTLTTSTVEILDIIFSQQLQNNDIIQLNLKQKDPTQVILCDASTFCSSNYGTLDYTGESGWFNLTLQSLENPKTTFNLDPDKIQIDFLNALRITSTEYSETNITYPSAAEAISREISVPRLYSWNYLTIEQTLNEQNISYEYSTDSGTAWNQVENFDLSNASITSKKIKIKAVLQSNETSTPIIYNITLSYFIEEPPVYYDINNTGTISLTVNQETTINESLSQTELKLSPIRNIEDAQINISIINSNISDTTKIKELEILAPELEDKLNNATLRIYYNENEIENITENSLLLKYFNETSQEWEIINSTLNTEENYMETILEHLSIYALFGEQNITEQPETPSSSSSESSGGGSEGSNNNRISRGNNQQPSIPTQPTQSKPQSQEQTEQQTIITQTESPSVTGNTIVDVGKILTAGKLNKSLWSLTLILIGIYVYIRKKEKGRQKFLSLR